MPFPPLCIPIIGICLESKREALRIVPSPPTEITQSISRFLSLREIEGKFEVKGEISLILNQEL